MSVGSGWTLFLRPVSQGWANLCSFAPNQHDPGSPRTGVPDSDRWGSVSKEWGGRGGGQNGSPGWLVAATPRRNSDSLGPRLSASQEEAPPGLGRRRGRQPLWVHTFTPGQITRHARESSPPISAQLFYPSSSPSPKKHAIWRTIGCLLTFPTQPPESLTRMHKRTFVYLVLPSQLCMCAIKIKEEEKEKEFTFWLGKEKIHSLAASSVHQRWTRSTPSTPHQRVSAHRHGPE